ncbi:hypothetical protein CEUSTIGMA_g7670.t1 [Chlamydomonas eustigma]|uniref:Uncharacterized protein n=1 Tax=Chlamydomonas eustigma TaxID=1157962 RepID=A0A250XBH9_9CHLO|nr:hypothetical protein CEUSTIGMA_g7670.t1 [Chlamydomonas eustigma]|eukprot:GAX80232.1 hypothetical protein CEUSTIGMA_g7670.t1 [Chlamydomonas eustigma]
MISSQLMKKCNGIFAIIGMIVLASAKAAAVLKSLRWNQLQVSTTVQSYHQAPSSEVLSLLSSGTYNLGTASQIAVSFTHLSLKKQLEMGIRGFEFSLNSDYKGGAFNQNAAVKLAGGDGSTVSPDLDVPGFKMFTEVDLDFGSSCYLLAKGFQIVKDWSDKNPGHLPFVIVLHSGSGASAFNTFASAVLSEGESALETMPGSPYNFTLPDPVSSSSPAGDLVAVERIVSSIFGSTLLTPAELIAMSGNPSAQTLNEAVLPPMGQWPEVKHLLGKVAVVLDPDYTVTYSGLHKKRRQELVAYNYLIVPTLRPSSAGISGLLLHSPHSTK